MPRQGPRAARGSRAVVDLPCRPRVVVVEDSALIQEFVEGLLAKEFTVAAVFVDAESCIDQWCGAAPDVIVLDITLPGLSGLDAASQLRQTGCGVPIVFCSVHEDDEIVHAALAAGALGYVAKRDIGTDLVPALRAVLSGRRFLSSVIELS